MDVAAYFVGLACGLVFLLPTVRRMRTAHAAMEAARALERSTQVELCVVRADGGGDVRALPVADQPRCLEPVREACDVFGILGSSSLTYATVRSG